MANFYYFHLLYQNIFQYTHRTEMEFTLANYTLPAMCHIVCTLVTTGISGVSIRETGENFLQNLLEIQIMLISRYLHFAI